MTEENRELATPTQHLRDIKRPNFGGLPAIRKKPLEEMERLGRVFVHFCWDKSQSFEHNDASISLFFTDLIQRAVNAGMEDALHLSLTEMSGRAVTSSYKPITQFTAVNLKSGGSSPHGEMLQVARQVDQPLIGAPKTALIRFIACDGRENHSLPLLEKELVWLRQAQEQDPRFHVFVIKLGPNCLVPLLKSMSPKRSLYDIYDSNFTALLDDVFKLILGTLEDPTVPARTMSLKVIARPNFNGGNNA